MDSLEVARFGRWKTAERKLIQLSELSGKAELFSKELAGCLQASNRPEFEIKLKNRTNLEFRLLGMSFITRAEATMNPLPIGRICTYLLGEPAPDSRTKISLEFTFDQIGNVNGGDTIPQAVVEFRTRIIEELNTFTTVVL
jgi:hypothetical protein